MILLLFNLLAIPRITQRQVVEVDYGTFMSMTESGEVGRAEIQEPGKPDPIYQQRGDHRL